MDRVRQRAAGFAALGILLGSMACATSGSDQASERDLARARAHFEMGIDYLGTGQNALALRELMAAEQYDPKNARIHHALAEAYRRKGKLAESEKHLKIVLELHPPFHDARLMLSSLYIAEERYDEAIAQAGILIDDPTFPGPWRALTNQGWAYYRLGRRTEARRDLESALEYNPTYSTALLNLGILEAEEGHHLEAIALFQATLEQEPRPGARAEVNYRLAEIYVSLGKRERAVDHLVTAVADAPKNLWGKKSEEYLRLLR
jgi:Tfp pilus assembly protein PilF